MHYSILAKRTGINETRADYIELNVWKSGGQ